MTSNEPQKRSILNLVWGYIINIGLRTNYASNIPYKSTITNMSTLRNFYVFVRFKVLTVANMKMVVFWVVAPCSLVEVYRCFRSACCLHHQGDKYGATSQTTVIFEEPEISPRNTLFTILTGPLLNTATFYNVQLQVFHESDLSRNRYYDYPDTSSTLWPMS
jgi:hypothetical protein